MLHLLWILIIGFIVGLVARAIHPGNDKMGFIFTTLLGVAGALLFGYAADALHITAGPIGSFIGAVVGAIVLVIIVSLVRKKTGS
ncbi:MAG: GlsB/YeaQ/YmgE family stress response membrane protein [Nevskiaceae bacterium]|nr:MAG: GlsB/YeaQ/YmgE family stress response membrane protein [Nevskiaceae bacterium]TBR73734.1 MAG: GlsB/YeaQ/YmgE family stress response membrane protein [Nevskiaceae bacterium]